MMYQLANPDLSGNEIKYVTDALQSGWISSHGSYIEQFERSVAEMAQTKYAVAANNGTTALHLALVAIGVQPSDEVIVPTLTYIATANAVKYCGATPVFVDSVEETLGIDVDDVIRKITPKTRAVIAVHLYGIPADVIRLRKICDEYGIYLIEDAAEAHGAAIEGQKVGSVGHLATFSFFGNKIVTTGEGGAVTTNSSELDAKLRLFRGQGMDPERRYWFPVIGYNYRMTNVQAAIGLAQMERLNDFLDRRQELADCYIAHLSGLDEISLPQPQPGLATVAWIQNVFLKDGGATRRDTVMASLQALEVDSRPVFYPMHVLPPYFDTTNVYPVADKVSELGFSLPLHVGLDESNIIEICEAVKQSVQNCE